MFMISLWAPSAWSRTATSICTDSPALEVAIITSAAWIGLPAARPCTIESALFSLADTDLRPLVIMSPKLEPWAPPAPRGDEAPLARNGERTGATAPSGGICISSPSDPQRGRVHVACGLDRAPVRLEGAVGHDHVGHLDTEVDDGLRQVAVGVSQGVARCGNHGRRRPVVHLPNRADPLPALARRGRPDLLGHEVGGPEGLLAGGMDGVDVGNVVGDRVEPGLGEREPRS